MVKVIMGLKGSGKTKRLIDLIRIASTEERGDVVCIEKDAVLTYDIPHSVRLVNFSQYKERDYTFVKGFISGLHAGNYDITHIFLDNLFKLADNESIDDADEFLKWCEDFSERENVRFTMTISADVALATETMKRYL